MLIVLLFFFVFELSSGCYLGAPPSRTMCRALIISFSSESWNINSYMFAFPEIPFCRDLISVIKSYFFNLMSII